MLEFQPTTFGDYILHDRIGAGGMAEIFLATAQGIEGFEKRLVIKRILPTLSDDEQFVRMFVEEAKLCVSLHHPNIVQVYDLGLIDGQYYIAMEYVDGRDLLKTLAACGKKKIGFPTDIALYIVMEVLKGLDYAHGLRKDGEPLGIIHRDVSPSNVLLSFEGEVKLGDFGIAKARTRERTATGILKGKFGYMAPEQVTGVPIDYRADIFAVGILLYELLTGHRLFAGKNDLAVLERVRNADISPPPRHYRADLDYELEHIVMKALAREPGQRFASCIELHDAIHDYVFRSRATVGPNALSTFMVRLFLRDEEEIRRRIRVRLPPIPGAPELPFGADDTDDERRLNEGLEDRTSEDIPVRRNSSITDGRESGDNNGMRAAVRALRQARHHDDPTQRASAGDPAIRPAASKISGISEGAVARLPSVADSDSGFSPSEIVERSASADGEAPATGDIEPTVRFNSERQLPPLGTRQLADEPTQTTSPPAAEPLTDSADGPIDGLATGEIEPRAEVLDAFPSRAETVDELDQTILSHDQKRVIERVLAAAAADRDPPKNVFDPSEPQPMHVRRATATEPDEPAYDAAAAPDASPFDDRTLTGTNLPDPELDATVAPGPFEEPTEDPSLSAVTEDQPSWSEIAALPMNDEPWGEKTIAQPPDGMEPADPFHTVDESAAPDDALTAALSEAASADEAIEALLSGQRDDTASGPLSSGEAPPTRDHDSRRRQARRRFSTNSVILYGENRPESSTAELPFDQDNDPSVPAITDAGRLGDDGASGLFGALSVLDQPELAFPEDDPQFLDTEGLDTEGLDTEGRFYADFSESMGRVRAVDPQPPRTASELRVGDEYGETRMGALARPLDEEGSLPSFVIEEEPTHSVSDGQVMSVPHSIHSALPEPELLSASASSIDLEFDDEPRRRELSFSTVNEHARPPGLANGNGRFQEDPTEQSGNNAVAGDTPLAPLDADLPWSPEELAGSADLVSASFELSLDDDDDMPAPKPRGPRAETPTAPPRRDSIMPVRPVSMVNAPGGVEDTGGPRPAQAGTFGAPGGSAALRAVVGRKGRIRELNRSAQPGRPPGEPARAVASQNTPPMAARPSRATPAPAAASRAQGSFGQWSGGTPSAPPALIVQRPRSPWINAALYGLPLLAVFLTVAALVSSVLTREQGVDPQPGRVVSVVDDDPPLTEDPRSIITRIQQPDGGAARPEVPLAPAEPAKAPDIPLPPPPLEGATAAEEPSTAPVSADPAGRQDRPRDRRRIKRRRRRAVELGRIRVRCDEPTVIRIAGVGAYRAAPQVVRRLPPGDYRLKMSRGGRAINTVAISLVAGQTLQVPCP